MCNGEGVFRNWKRHYPSKIKFRFLGQYDEYANKHISETLGGRFHLAFGALLKIFLCKVGNLSFLDALKDPFIILCAFFSELHVPFVSSENALCQILLSNFSRCSSGGDVQQAC